MKIVGIVNVRMGSSRLPGKVLRPVAGKPLLGHLLDRLSLARHLDDVVVATSERPENDAVEAYCRSRGIACFRGDEDDVLARMLGGLRSRHATVGVEVYGDCPLIDPAIVDQMIELYREAGGSLDFVGNDLTTSWPPGMEVEVFAMAALERAGRDCTDPAIREHGTLYIRQNPTLFGLRNIVAPPPFHRPELELEVDTAEDMEVVGRIIEHFADRPGYGLADLIAFLDAHPEVAEVNKDVPRRWKEFRADA